MFKRKRNAAEMKFRRQAQPTGVTVISGFLGAGKTSLIQKLLAGPLAGLKVVLIENDFGDLNLDANLLAEQGFTVRPLTQGCICCSLTGEFVASIRSVISSYRPDLLLIEPSGVGKLSDIRASLKKAAAQNLLVDRGRITVVDSLRCRLYYDNFADFFDDQVAEASTLFLSRTDLPEATAEVLAEARSLLASLNAKAPIYTEAEAVLEAVKEDLQRAQGEMDKPSYLAAADLGRRADSKTAPPKAAGNFRQVTLSFPRLPDPAWPTALFALLAEQKGLSIVRAKGVVQLADQADPAGYRYFELQYVPGDLRLLPTALEDNRITFIGPDLVAAEVATWVKEHLRRALADS